MQCAVLFTGGKDSSLALHLVSLQGHSIACLVVFVGGSSQGLFHSLNAVFVEKAAEALALPLVPFRLSGNPHSELFEVEEAFRLLERQFRIQGIVSGNITPDLRLQRLESLCRSAGLLFITPLRGMKKDAVLVRALEQGFTLLPIKVSAGSSSKELLGRPLDKTHLSTEMELRRFPSPIWGSVALDGPTFSKRLRILGSKAVWDSLQGLLIMGIIELEEK